MSELYDVDQPESLHPNNIERFGFNDDPSPSVILDKAGNTRESIEEWAKEIPF
jgi:hypothetical protein